VEAPAPRVERLEALTGFRFLAALVVVLSHLGPPPGAPEPLRALFASGYSGVTFFFVLSGFVITHNYAEHFRGGVHRQGLWSYAVARFSRVYPLYLLALVAVTLPMGWAELSRADWWLHALALQAWHPDGAVALAYNGPGWSISVEAFLYACFPLVAWLLLPRLRTRSALVCALVVVAAAMAALTLSFPPAPVHPPYGPDSAHRWLYRNPACRLGDFLLGALCARLLRTLDDERLRLRLGRACLLVGAGASVGLMSWPAHFRTPASFDLSYALPAAALVLGLALAPSTLAARALASAPLALLGEASYALYLVHYELLRRTFPVTSVPRLWWPLAGFFLLLCVGVAIGLHVVVERPARGWLRRRLDRAQRRPP
jgi:peptidoglycan/LPS O-acetylase OafA/YrhL